MASATVRISEESRELLRQLSHEAGEPMQDVLAKALEAYRRQRILQETNAAYAALREDPAAWQEVLEERAAWDATLADGLDQE